MGKLDRANKEVNRFEITGVENKTDIGQNKTRNRDKRVETKGVGFFVFLIIIFVASYYFFSKVYFEK